MADCNLKWRRKEDLMISQMTSLTIFFKKMIYRQWDAITDSENYCNNITNGKTGKYR